MSQALSIRGIAKSFGDNHVLRDVNLALPEGSTTALIGPSASGKSVLLKCAAGLLRLDAGQIDVLGQQDVHDWQALRPRIGVLFQRNALFDSMRVWQNVAFPLMRRGTVAKAARAEAFELLEQVGLAARAGEGWPKDLSGGAGRPARPVAAGRSDGWPGPRSGFERRATHPLQRQSAQRHRPDHHGGSASPGRTLRPRGRAGPGPCDLERPSGQAG
ncbi:MAG: ATP-binding cassette domain-containing protein [Alphaproteobacteria bacterium]